jgi:hypothetical protein
MAASPNETHPHAIPNGELEDIASPSREPSVRADQLDRFFHDFRRTIVDLERAYETNSLAKVIDHDALRLAVGPAVLNSYRRLISRPKPNDPGRVRRTTVHKLLDQIRNELIDLNHWFHLEPLDQSQSTWRLTDRFRVLDRTEDGLPIILRLDQLIDARVWGNGFVFKSQELTDRLVTTMVRTSLRQFARELSDLADLLPRVLRRPVMNGSMVAHATGQSFEQLIADILNEEAHHASLSRLSEDYAQKTDLRVKYPGLNRNRGARVQVTLTATESFHQQKVSSIQRADQYIILSPWSLASALPQLNSPAASSTNLDPQFLKRFWAAFDSPPENVADLALALRKTFDHALACANNSPLGPLAAVPQAIRELIRIWTQAEAFRSTQALRDWQQTDATYHTRRDGRFVYLKVNR